MEIYAVIGIDPGKKTGLAVFSWKHPFGVNRSSFHSEVVASSEVGDWIQHWIRGRQVPYVFCEPYVYGQKASRSTRQSHAQRVIGVVEEICRLNDIELKFQQQSAAKTFGDVERLKQLGWYKPDKEMDANDAASQAALGLAHRFPRVFLELDSVV